MKEVIEKIITYGTYAPSGENCQPWKFTVQGNTIFVYNIPERDDSLYSWGQRASYIAHGALLENMVIAASALGYSTAINETFPAGDPNLVATLTLTESPVIASKLFDAIPKRASNRKQYDQAPLTSAERDILLRGTSEKTGARFCLVEEKKMVSTLAAIGGINEQILFTNPSLHNFFFQHITWTKQEDDIKSIGFYLPTLELPPPAKLLFRVIKKWNFLQILNKLNFAKLIGKGNAQIYGSASAFGAIIIPNTNPNSFLEAGRLFERIWLNATELGLAIQPLTGVLFLKLKLLAGETDQLTPEHIELVNTSYQTAQTTFQTSPNEIIAVMFRIGHAQPPTAKSSRLKPIITWK